MNAASTQTAYKPTQSTATGSADPYFGGIGGGYQPPPAPPPPGGRPIATPFQDDLERRLQEDYREALQHIEEMKRLRDEARKKLVEEIKVDFGGGKRTTEAEMVDITMGTGGGPPPPPPGAAGYVRT